MFKSQLGKLFVISLRNSFIYDVSKHHLNIVFVHSINLILGEKQFLEDNGSFILVNFRKQHYESLFFKYLILFNVGHMKSKTEVIISHIT